MQKPSPADVPNLRVTHMTTADAARATRLPIAMFYIYAARGDLPASALRGYYARSDIDAWIRDRIAGKPLASGGMCRNWLDMSVLMTTQEALLASGLPSEDRLHYHVRRGDFPKPIAKGLYSRSEVAQWVVDRDEGKPLPLTGNILQGRQAIEDSYHLKELRSLTRYYPADIYKLTLRGDFPEPIARGRYAKRDVDNWVAARKAGKRLPGSGLIASRWNYEKQEQDRKLHAPLEPDQIRQVLIDKAWRKMRTHIPAGQHEQAMRQLEQDYVPTTREDLELNAQLYAELNAAPSRRLTPAVNPYPLPSPLPEAPLDRTPAPIVDPPTVPDDGDNSPFCDPSDEHPNDDDDDFGLSEELEDDDNFSA